MDDGIIVTSDIGKTVDVSHIFAFRQSYSLQYCQCWWRSPAVEHRSLADVLSLSCARLVADG